MSDDGGFNHPGQGTPLPDFLKCKGEWIVESYIFLYFDSAQPGLAPRFTVNAARHDGAPCVGFDVSQLAAALHVEVDAVLAANRDHTLNFLGVAETTPTRGGLTAMTYGFQLGDRKVSLTIERHDHEGTA